MNPILRFVLITALFLFVIAPFAGLAPLLLVLLLGGIAWIANDWLRIMLGKTPTEGSDESERSHPT